MGGVAVALFGVEVVQVEVVERSVGFVHSVEDLDVDFLQLG